MKVLVIGYFATVSNKIDGQIAKTKNVSELLQFTDNDLSYFDTETFKSNKFNIFKLLSKIIKSDTIVYLPAYGNLQYLFPLIYLFSVLSRSKIHYFVVGGWLVEFLQNKCLHIKMLKSIAGIYPEIEVMSQKLREEYGFSNVSTFTNFRICERVKLESRKDSVGRMLRIIYFARLTPEKGIDILFEVARQLKIRQIDKVQIDLYGQICYDQNELQQSLDRCKNVKYKGIIDGKDINHTLSKYDIMLFPTRYPGEGCPGTLADAMINGLAIICSDWRYNKEFVQDEYNGYLCSPYSYESYLERIIHLEQDRDLLQSLKVNSYNKGVEFTHTSALGQLRTFIKK